MKSQRVGKESPPPSSRQHRDYQPDQARRRDQGGLGREQREDEPADEEGDEQLVRNRPSTMPDIDYDVRFLLVWLLGIPGLCVLAWSLVAG